MRIRFFLVILLATFGVALPNAGRAQAYTILYQFCSQANCSDGSQPYTKLVRDAEGNLYGTTRGGGVNCSCGTVFKLAPDRTETVLHAFTGGRDGYEPYGGLIMDKEGNLYGTTEFGGDSSTCSGLGCGTVFKIAPDGTKRTIYDFLGSPDGADPSASLVSDSNGNLYGTTKVGGNGTGTVFRVSKAGVETVLYSFGAGGGNPEASLLLDAGGILFGTTTSGGEGFGTVFELAPDGTETTLHAFTAELPYQRSDRR